MELSWVSEQPPEVYDKLFGPGYDYERYIPIYNWIAERVQGPVLELGCGAGHLARILYERGIRRYLGVDFSPIGIRKAAGRVPLHFMFVLADIRRLSLNRINGHTVVAVEFLEHIRSDVEILSSIPPGTLVAGSVPMFEAGSHVRYFPHLSDMVERYHSCLSFLELKHFSGKIGGWTRNWWAFTARRIPS